MNVCPCGTGETYENCCGRYIEGDDVALTAEILMRSRFSAFVKHRFDYIERTCASEMRETFDRADAERGAGAVKWLRLQVLGSSLGGQADETGTVEFSAQYLADGEIRVHRENSAFRRENGIWVYVAGDVVAGGAPLPTGKIGRNDPCPCGSGRKFKKCCGA